MPNLYSFHKEELRKTRELRSLVQELPATLTDPTTGNVNTLTLVWALLKDENYTQLVACKDGAALKRALETDRLHIAKNGMPTLSLANYNRYKSQVNGFYQYLLRLAVFYAQNRIWINREKILKELKSQDPSLLILLRQEQLAFRLQRLVGLPKILAGNNIETERPETNFESKKMLDEFLSFLRNGTNENNQPTGRVASGLRGISNAIRQHREVAVTLMMLVVIAAGAPLWNNYLKVDLVRPSQGIVTTGSLHITATRYNATAKRLQLTVTNLGNTTIYIEAVEVLDMVGQVQRTVPKNWVLAPESIVLLNVPDIQPNSTGRVRVLGHTQDQQIALAEIDL